MTTLKRQTRFLKKLRASGRAGGFVEPLDIVRGFLRAFSPILRRLASLLGVLKSCWPSFEATFWRLGELSGWLQGVWTAKSTRRRWRVVFYIHVGVAFKTQLGSFLI